MQRRAAPGLCALTTILLLSAIAAPHAAELALTPWVSGAEDLLQVQPRPDGGLAILRPGHLTFLSPAGQTVAQVEAGPAQTLWIAVDGRAYGLATHTNGAADFAPVAAFELRDADGALLWSIGPTDDMSFDISTRGTVVGKRLNINIPERNALHFYGPGGTRLAEVVVPRLEGGRFSDDGDAYFAQSATEGLIAFDPQGTELWRHAGVRLFAVTPDGGTVAAVAGDRLELLAAGAVMAASELASLLVRRVAIAPDGGRIAIAGREELHVYDEDLRRLWSESLSGTGFVFTAVDVSANDGWLLAGVARDLGPSVPVEARHPRGEVRAYDAAGRLRHQAALTFDAWNIFTPTARLDASGAGATITTRRAAYRTVLP